MVRGGLRAMGQPWQRGNPLFTRPPIEKWYVTIGNSIIRYESNETTMDEWMNLMDERKH